MRSPGAWEPRICDARKKVKRQFWTDNSRTTGNSEVISLPVFIQSKFAGQPSGKEYNLSCGFVPLPNVTTI
jgi:hypothetical protein